MFAGLNFRGIVMPSGTPPINRVFAGNGGSFDCCRMKYVSFPKTLKYTTVVDGNVWSLKKFILPDYDNSTLSITFGYAKSLTHYIVPGTYTTIKVNACCGS